MEENLDLSKNTEIEKALKEFEIQSNQEQAQKASETLNVSETSGMAGLIIKLSGGLVKDEEQANYVLLGIAILAIATSLFLIFGIGNKGKATPLKKLPSAFTSNIIPK